MKHRFLAFLTIPILLLTNSFICFGASGRRLVQSGQTSNPQIDKIIKRVRELGSGEDVTVILLTGKKYHGSIRNIEADNFQIAEVDLKQNISINYIDVKKVIKGYGEKRLFGGRPNPHNPWIGRAIPGGILAALIIAIATAKD